MKFGTVMHLICMHLRIFEIQDGGGCHFEKKRKTVISSQWIAEF